MKEEKEVEKSNDKKNRLWIASGIIIAIALVVYLSGVFYFRDKFLVGSEINSVSVAANTVDEAKAKLEKSFENYELNIEGKGIKEKITGEEINIEFKGGDNIDQLYEKQNSFSWIGKFFSPVKDIISDATKYDEKKLVKVVDDLAYFKKANVKEVKNASFKYDENKGEYIIIPEEDGSKLDKKLVLEEIKKAISKGETSLNLEEVDCYIKPKYLKDSKETLKAKEELDLMLKTKVTYNFGSKEEVLDKEKISKWLTVDKNMKAIVDKKKVKGYVGDLAAKYNTVGRTRQFKTSVGVTANVSGGNYGYAIDVKKETEELAKIISEGREVGREAEFSQKGKGYGTNDIGDTYVEINLSSQHIWFYKNGQLLTEGGIVTGNLSRGWGTPPGVFKLTYKQRDATLVGEGYKTPVTFWMPFNGGIGLHDATWRSSFGGNIYKTNGSHGCVNLPYGVAQTIFNHIDSDTTIVCYY